MELIGIPSLPRVCIACHRIYGCHGGGHRPNDCTRCINDACTFAYRRLTPLEAHGVSVTGGICDACWQEYRVHRAAAALQAVYA